MVLDSGLTVEAGVEQIERPYTRSVEIEPWTALAVSSSFIIQVHQSPKDIAKGFSSNKLGIFARTGTPVRYEGEQVVRQSPETDPDEITHVVKSLDKQNNELLIGDIKLTLRAKVRGAFSLMITSPEPITFYELPRPLKPESKDEVRSILGTKNVTAPTNSS